MGKSRFEKHCIVCGARYEYCSNCDRFSRLPRWMESFHDDNCHIIFNTVMEYKAGVKTAKEAASILKKCDLSHRENINDGLNIYITAILADGKDVAKEEPKVDEVKLDVVEEPKVEVAETEKYEEKKEEPKQEKKQFNNHKKNNFKK